MQTYLRIHRIPYEEPHALNLVIEASNGHLKGAMEIYSTPLEMTNFARELQEFPAQSDAVEGWTFGSEKRSAHAIGYFQLQVFQSDPRGQCALAFRFNNNRPHPEREIAEFSVKAYPADLERLGQLLEAFGRLQHQRLEWTVTEGQLYR